MYLLVNEECSIFKIGVKMIMTLCFFYSRNLKKSGRRGAELFGRVVTVVERAMVYSILDVL